MRRRALILLAVACIAPRQGSAADPTAGKAVFNRCRICHSIEADAGNRVGPNLHGMFGRKAGSVEGFAYSEAMRKSGIVWDDKTLAEYLRNPRALVPGNKMAFPGIADDKELADLIAYLHEAAQ